VRERRGGAGKAPEQPLLQHGAETAQRRKLPEEQGGDRGRAAARDLPRDAARLAGGAGDGLLHEDRTARSRRQHAQPGALVGWSADHDGVGAVDRGLRPRDRRAGEGDRDRGWIRVPRRHEPHIRLRRKHAQHVGHMRMSATQQRYVYRHQR
jgi:hypothetical protein